MRERTRPVRAALAFLTVLPVGDVDERDLRRGLALLPLAGAAVGGLVALVAWGAASALPPLAAGALGAAAGVVLTAALHLDGLGDTADGIGARLAGADPAAAMRDPRLGAFGVAAIALDLFMKSVLLAALTSEGFPWAVVAAAALSRWAPVALAWRLPYAGSGSGAWTDATGPRPVAIAAALALVVAVPAVAWRAAPMALAVVAVTPPLARWARRALGGSTGDVAGAAIELAELSALAVAVAA
jgi:adenosylcobinamide-GDP ribazoletransferase